MSTDFTGIDLGRIEPEVEWEDGDVLDGVDIVFFSKKPRVGQVIVGWYKNAKIFHRHYGKSVNPFSKGQRWSESTYLCETQSENAFLLNEDDRTLKVT